MVPQPPSVVRPTAKGIVQSNARDSFATGTLSKYWTLYLQYTHYCCPIVKSNLFVFLGQESTNYNDGSVPLSSVQGIEKSGHAEYNR